LVEGSKCAAISSTALSACRPPSTVASAAAWCCNSLGQGTKVVAERVKYFHSYYPENLNLDKVSF